MKSRIATRLILTILTVVLSGSVLLIALVYGASEVGGEVVTLSRPEPDGSHSNVRIWIVDDRGVSWIEHGDADSHWIRLLDHSPQLTLIRDGEAKRYLATPDPAAHGQYHRLRQEKYGLADDIVALFLGAEEEGPGVPTRLELRTQ